MMCELWRMSCVSFRRQCYQVRAACRSSAALLDSRGLAYFILFFTCHKFHSRIDRENDLSTPFQCLSVEYLTNINITNTSFCLKVTALECFCWLNPFICFNKVLIVIAGLEIAWLHTVESWCSVEYKGYFLLEDVLRSYQKPKQKLLISDVYRNVL